ncbi:MAG: gluconate 2-dehydrogenase subunit 3 family protein [Alphaproteobacteria bacterium]|nr:gluconate 2-dehydrogenase subunit 3 family protein [Alphaproteobacteria bacterium]
MSRRFPGYDVLAKRHTPSWNEKTRQVIDQRLASPREPRFLDAEEWQTLCAICDRIVPQPTDRPPVPLAAMIDDKLYVDRRDGYRDFRLPPQREAWRKGLAGVDAEARRRHSAGFAALSASEQDALLLAVQQGEMIGNWDGMPPAIFFAKRLLFDIATAYYTHPTAWNEIGFGGPASPRGYVRMGFDRRDPWEAAEAAPGGEQQARRENARIG